jgi:predicted DNA binding CopG/RHH family protein
VLACVGWHSAASPRDADSKTVCATVASENRHGVQRLKDFSHSENVPPVNIGRSRKVKTTIEIPDALFRRAKSAAAERGVPLRALVSEAIAHKLRTPNGKDKPWMGTFGKLRHLHTETNRINRIIEEEFGRIKPEDWK